MPTPSPTLLPELGKFLPALPSSQQLEATVRDTVPALAHIPSNLVEKAAGFGINLVVALILMAIGWVLAGWLSNRAARSLGRISDTAASFLASSLRFIIILVAFVVAIIQLGVPSQTLVTIMGAIVVALGLGLKDTLTNVAAGIMLLVNRPFDVGDYVEIDKFAGTVKRINLFQTELNTYKNIRVFMPNKKIWDNTLQNYSHNSKRMVELAINFDHSQNPATCREGLASALLKHDKVLSDPQPFIGLAELAGGAMTFTVRLWVKTPDWSSTRYSILDVIKNECAARHLLLFPQTAVEKAAKPAKLKSKRATPPTSKKARQLAKPSTQTSNTQTTSDQRP